MLVLRRRDAVLFEPERKYALGGGAGPGAGPPGTRAQRHDGVSGRGQLGDDHELEAAGIAGPAIGIPPPVTLGIQGAWADVPRGTRLLSGTLILDPEISPGGPVQVLNVAAQTGGFTATRLTRVVFTPPPQQEDIQSVFELVHKNLDNDETLADLARVGPLRFFEPDRLQGRRRGVRVRGGGGPRRTGAPSWS